jgi:hypothetical protein
MRLQPILALTVYSFCFAVNIFVACGQIGKSVPLMTFHLITAALSLAAAIMIPRWNKNRARQHRCSFVDIGNGMEKCDDCGRERCYAPDPDDDRQG